MKNSIYKIAAALLMLGPLGVSAAPVDFEDIAVPSGTQQIGGDIISGGFLFDSSSDHSHTVNDMFDSHNGTTYIGWDDFRGDNVVTMSMIGGGTFELGSIDFTEFFDATIADLILVTGSGGQSKIIDLDNIADGAGGANDFQTEYFNWTGLTYVTFNAQGTEGDSWWGFDNITLVAVPAPGPAVLLLLGLAGLGFSRRRQ